MKDKSLFTKVILLIVLCVICIVMTVGVSLLFGAIDITLFDFSKLNFSNMIPILIIGGFLSCVVVGIAVLFLGKSAFLQFHEYIKKKDDENKGDKK